MAASGAFKPEYIIERTELAYGPVVVQSDRLVQKTILVKDKKNKTSNCFKSLLTKNQPRDSLHLGHKGKEEIYDTKKGTCFNQ